MGRLNDAEIYQKYAGELVRFTTGLVGPSDAADAVSSAFLHCMSSKKWLEVQNHRAFLYRCVLNEARQHQRSTKRRLVREALTSGPASFSPADVRPEVLKAVARLSARQRAAIFLTYWADMDPSAIAALLGLSEGTVRSNLARGRAHLRRMLDA